MEAHNEVDLLCIKVKAISQGPNAELLKKFSLRENRFGFEPEFTAKVARARCRIYEVPISYSGRDYTEGKKIGWKDGVAALYFILKYHFLD